MSAPDPDATTTTRLSVGSIAALLVATGLLLAVGLGVLLVRHAEVTAPATGASGTSDAALAASEDGWAAFEHHDDGTPVRWDPCTTIEVVVSSAGAPSTVDAATFRTDVEEALVLLRAASGLELRVIGATAERPRSDRSTVANDADGGRRWAPVLVGWRSPGGTSLPLRDTDRGIAMPVATGAPGARQYVTGQVVLNGDRDDLRSGRADRATSWGATILHELAHILGLDHVDDPDELLSVHPGRGPVVLGPGDRAGLEAVGADGACLDTPAPTELDLDVPDR